MTSAHTPDEVLTSQEVADIFRVEAGTVRRWAMKGLVPSFTTPGGHLRFYWRDVSTFVPTADPAPAGAA